MKTGFYDAAVIAYNIVHGDFCQNRVSEAYETDVGVVVMKSARSFYSGNDPVKECYALG